MEYYHEGDFQKYIDKDFGINKKNTKKEEQEVKINEVERGLFYLCSLMQMIQEIKFLHSNNIVHCDIKFKNFLLTNDKIPLIGDMVNIQIEYSFFKSGVFSEVSNYLKSPKHQDTYSFEMICIGFLNQINLNYEGDEFQCSLMEEMKINIKKLPNEKEKTHPTIAYYNNVMSDKDMYFLPKSKVNKYQNVQIDKFTELLLGQGEAPVKYQDLLTRDITTVEDFNSCIDDVLKLSCDDPKYIPFSIKFSSKIHELIKNKIIKRKEKKLIAYIQNIDYVITKYFNQDRNERISILAFERIYLNKLDNTELNEEQILMIKYSLLQFIKDETNYKDKFHENIIYIIDFLEKIKDDHVGYFYTALFPPGKDRNGFFNDDVLLRSRAINFFYNYNTKVKKMKVNVDDYKELIFEIFQIILDRPDKRNEFKEWLIDTSQDIISLFFYLFAQNQIKYGELNSLFDDVYNKFEPELITAKKKSNEYLEFMFKAFQFRKDNGEKLSLIYQNYIIPSFNA